MQGWRECGVLWWEWREARRVLSTVSSRLLTYVDCCGIMNAQAQSLMWADLSPEKLNELKALGSGAEYEAYDPDSWVLHLGYRASLIVMRVPADASPARWASRSMRAVRGGKC